MLVLIATNELQGIDPGDYAHTVEGELVTPLATDCASGERCVCNRGFPGLASGHATTTAMIVERPGVTEDDLRDAVYDWLDRGGWIDLLEQTAQERAARTGNEVDDVDEIIVDMIDEHVDTIAQVCVAYPEGTVVIRRGDLVVPRSMPSAA